MKKMVAAFLLVAGQAAAQGVPALPIPQNPDDVSAVPAFAGIPAQPQPLRSFPVPQHPFMANNDDNNLHNDAYMTDAYGRPGPLGRNMDVTSTFQIADCASVTFDPRDRIITICMGVEGPRLLLLDPESLEILSALPLPPRSGRGTGSSIFNDFSGGGYFYLDNKGRAVVPTNTRQIWVVGVTDGPLGPSFAIERTYDLISSLSAGDGVVSVLPDWRGRLWFVTAGGTVGVVDPESGTVDTHRLDGEIIANSFAVAPDGVYIASDHALYRFRADPGSGPNIVWRATYDRGTRVKPGQASQGSGTTPTIIDRRYVAITDNADPYMQVLVYNRHTGELVCAESVFAEDAGNTDQSLIAVGNSLVVENNYGYSGPTATTDGATTTPGLTRVDFGPTGCRTVWESKEIAPSVVPKVSLATGLIYTYTKPRNPEEVDAWYLTAIDFRTGETVFKQLAGTGLGYNNNYAPIIIGPDGAAYIGVLGGLVRMVDV